MVYATVFLVAVFDLIQPKITKRVLWHRGFKLVTTAMFNIKIENKIKFFTLPIKCSIVIRALQTILLKVVSHGGSVRPLNEMIILEIS